MTRIDDDMGGSLGQYLLKFAAIRDSGERVMIDGSCFSGCTLVTALIPKQRVCVTNEQSWGSMRVGLMIRAVSEPLAWRVRVYCIRCIHARFSVGSAFTAVLGHELSF
jgi:hypothetical protein